MVFLIQTPVDRFIKILRCHDVKRNTRIWGRVPEKTSEAGVKIFSEKVVGPRCRFMMGIFVKCERIQVFWKEKWAEMTSKRVWGVRRSSILFPDPITWEACRHGRFLKKQPDLSKVWKWLAKQQKKMRQHKHIS